MPTCPKFRVHLRDRINQLGKGSCYHGNAGIASAFAALGDKKLKPGGVLALVLPLSAASGLAWQGLRQMLRTGYGDLTVLSIAADGKDMSFSSDTGMAECLVVARKGLTASQTGHFTSLRSRPLGFAHASALAKGITEPANVRGIEDGPYGGSYVVLGNEVSGETLKADAGQGNDNWGSVRLLDGSVAQTSHALSQSKMWLPGSPEVFELPMVALKKIGNLGLVDRDINGPPPRGPFTKISGSPTSTYPSLWNHRAKEESRLVCEPDSQLQVRSGMELKAASAWATASRTHLNRDFTFGSQALAVAFTVRESMGGRVWPNVIFEDNRLDYAGFHHRPLPGPRESQLIPDIVGQCRIGPDAPSLDHTRFFPTVSAPGSPSSSPANPSANADST